MNDEKEEAKFGVTVAQCLTVVAIMLLLTGLGSCWIENAYSVRRIEAAVHGGVKYEVHNGLHHETPWIVTPTPSPTK